MIVKYSPSFIAKLKKSDVRIRKSFNQKITLFYKNPTDPQLNNHPLKDKWQGHISIDITADWRAVYEEIEEHNKPAAYFVAIGTHKELYR